MYLIVTDLIGQTGIMEQTFRQSMKRATPGRLFLLCGTSSSFHRVFFFLFLTGIKALTEDVVHCTDCPHDYSWFCTQMYHSDFFEKPSVAGVHAAKQESIRNTLKTENSFTVSCWKLFTFTFLLFIHLNETEPLCQFKPGWWHLDDSVWMHICQHCTITLMTVMLLTCKHQVWCEGF